MWISPFLFWQNLVKLKEIDLSSSKYLTKIPDLSKAKMIEKICLHKCVSLEEVHSSIQYLNTLELLELGNCHNLMKLPSKIDSKVLNYLCVFSCPRIKRLPEYQGENLKSLYLDMTAIKDATSTLPSILRSSALVKLIVYNCGNLSSLPENFYKLKSLSDFYFISLQKPSMGKLTITPWHLGTLTLHLDQWIVHPDRKLINKHNLKWHIRPDRLNWYL